MANPFGRPKPEKPKEIVLKVMIDKEFSDKLQAYCSINNVIQSVLVRRLLSAIIDNK